MLYPSCLSQTRHGYQIPERRTVAGFVMLVRLVIQFLYQKKLNGKQLYMCVPLSFLANEQKYRGIYDKHGESLLVKGFSRHGYVVYA